MRRWAAAILMLAALSARAADTPADLDAQNLKSFLSIPGLSLIRFYKKVLAPVRAASCPMFPSDSAFALEAFDRRGPFWGALMASDRVQRCGNDLAGYPGVVRGGRMFYFDPVETVGSGR